MCFCFRGLNALHTGSSGPDFMYCKWKESDFLIGFKLGAWIWYMVSNLTENLLHGNAAQFEPSCDWHHITCPVFPGQILLVV